jgi:hypothetical protein
MKTLAFALLFAGTMLTSGVALADADDAKWVAQCVKDNQNEKASVEVISKYCTCMNNKMSSSETRSISTWEKSHPDEMKACDKEAGWR